MQARQPVTKKFTGFLYPTMSQNVIDPNVGLRKEPKVVRDKPRLATNSTNLKTVYNTQFDQTRKCRSLGITNLT